MSFDQALRHNYLQALVELICDIQEMEEAVLEMKYDTKKAPLGMGNSLKSGHFLTCSYRERSLPCRYNAFPYSLCEIKQNPQ